MNKFLVFGLLGGAVCVLVDLGLHTAARKKPDLAPALEILISSIGVSGGIKICRYVLTGDLARAFKMTSVPLSEEDLVYFIIGAIALIWISVQVILKQLFISWKAVKSISSTANVPPQLPPQGPK